MRLATNATACAAALLAGSACSKGPETYGDDLANVETPPRGYKDIVTWLEAGHYKAWTCQPEPHPAAPPSPHGANRICNNAILSGAANDGPFEVGAASVKEIYDRAGRLSLYAVYRKVEPGAGGDTWYWYEGAGDEVVANGEGEDTCTDCHDRAPRDYVFTLVN
ncbi:MAG: hypothetical protein AB7O24_01595 [Kofleriaceae bacterium]